MSNLHLGPSLPDESMLQMIEQSPDRLVLHIAGGGETVYLAVRRSGNR